MKPVIVIPTNRETQFARFITLWQDILKGCHLIVVQDTQRKTIDFSSKDWGFTADVYDWTDIDKDLGKESWIIPRKTDCIRSYGFLKALELKPLFILTLDDDTEPIGDTIQDHYKILFSDLKTDYKYYNTMKNTLPRGHFIDLKSKFSQPNISHGIWIGTPDLAAHDQLQGYTDSTEEDFNKGIIPSGSYFSMCGMNLAFKPGMTKYLYFGLQGSAYPIDRCGDIWAGYYASKKRDAIIATGYAKVTHSRASNAWTNLSKESGASDLSFQFRQVFCEHPVVVDPCHLLNREGSMYFDKLKVAYSIWDRLCNERFKQ